MNDDLLARDELGFEEWSATPDPETLVPDSIARERDRESFRAKIESEPDKVVVSHTDADGLTSAALLHHWLSPENSVVQTVGYQDPYGFVDVLEDLLDDETGFEPAGSTLLVSDFNPDNPDCAALLGELVERGCKIKWYDHHQWPDETRNAVENAGVELHIDTDECAASLIERELYATLPEHLSELVTVTKDRDLWINEDPRSEDLSTYAFFEDADEYMKTVFHHGVEFPDDVRKRIEEHQQQNAKLGDVAVEWVWVYNELLSSGEEYTVGMAYTAGGDISSIGNRIVTEHEDDCDLAVIATPDSISFRSDEESDSFPYCHEVAGKLGGGGHKNAAGCGVPVDVFRELAEYWASSFKRTRVETEVLSAIRETMEGK